MWPSARSNSPTKEQCYEGTILSSKQAVDDSTLYAHLSTPTKYRLSPWLGGGIPIDLMSVDAHRAFVSDTTYRGANAENWLLRFQAAKMNHDFADSRRRTRTDVRADAPI